MNFSLSKFFTMTAVTLTVTVILAGHGTFGAAVDVECPAVCPTNWAPLCGSDGKTYANECDMKAKTCKEATPVTKVQDGECPAGAGMRDDCPKFCTQIYKPVCGSDGKTYGNECEMIAKACHAGVQVTKASDGECPKKVEKKEDCPAFCTQNYRPVCGSDGKTYSNECEMAAKACREEITISKVHNGECNKTASADPAAECNGEPVKCQQIYLPVCGSDGKTYANECSMRADACRDGTKVVKNHDGACAAGAGEKAADDCPTVCTADYKPVCGSDGKTYSNACALNAANCKLTNKITQVYDGECGNAPVSARTWCRQSCPDEERPVCGSDGTTYTNECNLKMQSCRRGIVIDVVHVGPCDIGEQSCDAVCPLNYIPLCGSDGITYSNECQLQLHNCNLRKELGSKFVEVKNEHPGGC